MKTRGLRLWAVGLALLGTAACDDNPVSSDRDTGRRFQLNPSTAAVVTGGDSIIVSAVLLNEYGEATGAAVTAEPCDARITAVKSEERLGLEPPERFVVRATGNLGYSCLIVSAGGVRDTIELRVVPASMRVTLPASVESGQAITPNIEFLNAQGNVVTGFTAADVELSVANVGGAHGPVARMDGDNIYAFWPGQARVSATLGYGYSITSADTTTVTPAPMPAGWLSATSGIGGELVTINKGSAIGGPTGVVFNGKQAFVHEVQANALVVAVGAPGEEDQLWVTGIDPYVVYEAAFEVLTPVDAAGRTLYDIWEANTGAATSRNNTRSFSNPTLTSGVPAYMNMHISDDRWDYVIVEVTEPGEYDLRLDWFDDSDNEIWVYNVAGYAGEELGTYPGCETVAAEGPEACTMTVAEPGTYWLRVLKLGDDANHSWTPVRVIATRR